MNQQEIADRLGISQSTVSLVLKDPGTARVSEKTKNAIIRYLKKFQYMSPAGKKRNWNIGYVSDVFQDLHQDFFQDSLRGIEEEAARQHYNLIMECFRGRELNLVRNSKVDGLIIRSGKACEFLQQKTALPMVLLNCASPVTRCDSVMPDNRSGMHKIAQYLSDCGRSKVAFISCRSQYSPFSCNYQERHFSFLEACACSKIECLADFAPEPSLGETGIRERIAALAARWKKMKRPPETVVTVNHFFACMVREVWPETEVIAGDNKVEGGFSRQEFPMLIQDADYMGRMAAELLIKRITEPSRQHVRINCDMDLRIPEDTKK